jgi:putative RNA 2'-phosphotransferase
MMTEKETTHLSKTLSYVLRHRPEAIGIELDEHGWTDVKTLLEKLRQNGDAVSIDALNHAVSTNSKKRFSFNEDGTKIRASQGHSVDVELGYTEKTPPDFLYHGTVAEFIGAIKAHGLQKMKRQHVHLSADEETAVKVALRRGKPVILQIKAAEMFAAGHAFYLSDNGVWLADAVAPAFITFPAL